MKLGQSILNEFNRIFNQSLKLDIFLVDEVKQFIIVCNNKAITIVNKQHYIIL